MPESGQGLFQGSGMAPGCGQGHVVTGMEPMPPAGKALTQPAELVSLEDVCPFLTLFLECIRCPVSLSG